MKYTHLTVLLKGSKRYSYKAVSPRSSKLYIFSNNYKLHNISQFFKKASPKRHKRKRTSKKVNGTKRRIRLHTRQRIALHLGQKKARMNCSKDKGYYTGQLQDRERNLWKAKEEISSVQELRTKKVKEFSSEPEKID